MPRGIYERKPNTKGIEDYLGPYEIILAQRIKETIIMFDEGLARWFRDKDQRTTLKQRRSYAIINAALKEARNDRQRFIQAHNEVPTKMLAELFGISSPAVSYYKNAKELIRNEYRKLLGVQTSKSRTRNDADQLVH